MKKYIHAGCVGFIICIISIFGFFTLRAQAMIMVWWDQNDSVAFIPGIEASRLYTPGLLFQNMLWEPNWNADVDKLAMDINGKSIRNDIDTNDLVNSVGALFWKSDVYDGFMKYMNGLVSAKTISEWKPLPYDWRLGLGDIVNGGTLDKDGRITFLSSTTPDVSFMIAEIQSLADRSLTHKVTLVAHSNGGLVAKVLIQKLQELKDQGQSNLIDKIDRVIMIAVPQLGAMDAVGSLLHGYKLHYLGGLVLNENHARAMAENMPGAYNLLPSKKYFENNVGPVITFATSTDTLSNLSAVYGRSISDYSSLEKFLIGGDGRQDPSFGDVNTPNVLNKKLITDAENQHSTLDNWQFPPSIEVIQVAGVGVETLSGLQYKKGSVCSNDIMMCKDVLNPEPMFSEAGDGTVMSQSALVGGGKQLYFDLKSYNENGHASQHSNIMGASPIQELIKNSLVKSANLPNYISITMPVGGDTKLLVDAYSSVSLNAYDEVGNHTGLIDVINPNSDIQPIEQNIPNSFYGRFGGKKYISLPAAAPATITFQGTEYGSATIDTSVTQNGVVIASSTFVDIPITPESNGTVIYATSTAPVLTLDINGDGVVDATTTATKAFDPILYIEMMKKIIESFDLKKAPEKLLIQRLDQLENKIKAGKIKNADKQIKKLITKIDRTNKKLRKISESERAQLVKMLSNLVDNLI